MSNNLDPDEGDGAFHLLGDDNQPDGQDRVDPDDDFEADLIERGPRRRMSVMAQIVLGIVFFVLGSTLVLAIIWLSNGPAEKRAADREQTKTPAAQSQAKTPEPQAPATSSTTVPGNGKRDPSKLGTGGNFRGSNPDTNSVTPQSNASSTSNTTPTGSAAPPAVPFERKSGQPQGETAFWLSNISGSEWLGLIAILIVLAVGVFFLVRRWREAFLPQHGVITEEMTVRRKAARRRVWLDIAIVAVVVVIVGALLLAGPEGFAVLVMVCRFFLPILAGFCVISVLVVFFTYIRYKSGGLEKLQEKFERRRHRLEEALDLAKMSLSAAKATQASLAAVMNPTELQKKKLETVTAAVIKHQAAVQKATHELDDLNDEAKIIEGGPLKAAVGLYFGDWFYYMLLENNPFNNRRSTLMLYNAWLMFFIFVIHAFNTLHAFSSFSAWIWGADDSWSPGIWAARWIVTLIIGAVMFISSRTAEVGAAISKIGSGSGSNGKSGGFGKLLVHLLFPALTTLFVIDETVEAFGHKGGGGGGGRH